MFMRCGLLLLLLVSLALPPTTQAASISASARLGEWTTATLMLSNSTAASQHVRLFEAWPAMATSRAMPQSLRVPLPALAEPLDPALVSRLNRDGHASMLVFLADQADLATAAAIDDWNERGAAVVEVLREHAKRTQAPLVAALEQQGVSVRSFWIVNAVLIDGDLPLAQRLMARDDVGVVMLDAQHHLEPPVTSTLPERLADALDVPWGLDRINANQVWDAWDIHGEGIIVANIDTGVQVDHPTLLEQYRGWSAAGLSHDYNWFDPTAQPWATPRDVNGHGTHTMGTIVGGAAGSLRGIGVAPRARWIAARGCESSSCSDSNLIASAEWMLAPTRIDGSAPRPDLRPHIINNSWAGDDDDLWFTGYVTAWNAAGIFSTFAMGNRGILGCGTAQSPGNYSHAFGIGATDRFDQVASFSARGPSINGATKPDMSAPGVDVLSADSSGDLESLNGTSMASPHVAGVAALLWSANPLLIGDLPATQAALTGQSVPLFSTQCGDHPTERPNNVYGWGRLDALASVITSVVDVPWLALPEPLDVPANATLTVTIQFDGRQVPSPGTYQAEIVIVQAGVLRRETVEFVVQPNAQAVLLGGETLNRWTGAGVRSHVQLPDGPPVMADASGQFTVTLNPGVYPVMASATGYLPETAQLSTSIPAKESMVLTPDAPHAVVVAPPLSATLAFGETFSVPISVSNNGTQPLSVSAHVPADEWTSTALPAVGLYDLSAFPALPLNDETVITTPLQLDFNILAFGTTFDTLFVSSNGWVSTKFQWLAQAGPRCLPSTALPAVSFAPFWADLDPSAGGAVRAGHVNPETFVVSFDDIPLWNQQVNATSPRYSFQIVFRATGEIEYRYGAMGILPSRWSIGVGFNGIRGQSFGCWEDRQLELSNTRWQVEGQAAANTWLDVQPTASMIAPGTTMTFTSTLYGLGYSTNRHTPMRGMLQLTTNDPLHSALDVPAKLVVGAPPQRIFVPTAFSEPVWMVRGGPPLIVEDR